MTDPLTALPMAPTPPPASQDSTARTAALGLETAFLAEMLKSSGFGEQDNSFSGSAGEDQFASFHRHAVAREMVRAGGIGLTEVFLNAMTETPDEG